MFASTSAWAEIERAGDPGEALRPPPLLQALKLATRLPYEIARRIEHAGDDEGPRSAQARSAKVLV